MSIETSTAPKGKRGARQLHEIRASIVSNVPVLIEDVKLDIVCLWRRDVQIAFIAKMHRLTVLQVEAVLWEAHCGRPSGPFQVGTAVRGSRGLHVVAERIAA